MSGYVLDASVAVTALTEQGSPAAGLLSGNDAAFQVPLSSTPKCSAPCAAYDAAYVALAELTGANLVTGDERVTASPGTRCEIQIIK
jgi:hypothetical protein